MRDDIDVQTSETFLAEFQRRADKEYAFRIGRIMDGVTEYMSIPASRDVLIAMISMDDMARYQTFEHVMCNTDGAKSIAGMEATLSFIGNYILDDSFCRAIPFVPAASTQEEYRGSLTLFEDETEAEIFFLEWMAEQARWLVLIPGEGEDGSCLDCLETSKIVEIIAHNEALREEKDKQTEENQKFLDSLDGKDTFVVSASGEDGSRLERSRIAKTIAHNEDLRHKQYRENNEIKKFLDSLYDDEDLSVSPVS